MHTYLHLPWLEDELCSWRLCDHICYIWSNSHWIFLDIHNWLFSYAHSELSAQLCNGKNDLDNTSTHFQLELVLHVHDCTSHHFLQYWNTFVDSGSHSNDLYCLQTSVEEHFLLLSSYDRQSLSHCYLQSLLTTSFWIFLAEIGRASCRERV